MSLLVTCIRLSIITGWAGNNFYMSAGRLRRERVHGHIKESDHQSLCARNSCAARHALMRICVAKNSEHLTRVEGVDTSRSVRNSDVCVRIIAGDLANVTRDFPRPEPRGNDVKRGATLPVLIW